MSARAASTSRLRSSTRARPRRSRSPRRTPRAITLDDGRSAQNPDPAIHPNGGVFTLDNTFRGGDLVTNATGMLDYRFDRSVACSPPRARTSRPRTPRPPFPTSAATTRVASFNVLNYFTTLDARGANTAEEFDRQEAKIVSAIAADRRRRLRAHRDREQRRHAVATLVARAQRARRCRHVRLHRHGGASAPTRSRRRSSTSRQRSRRSAVYAMLGRRSTRFLDDFNRPALAQTFADSRRRRQSRSSSTT